MVSHSIAERDNTGKPEKFGKIMLEWYARNQRDLPWRAKKGETPNPYYVWLSEVMLQQTTVPAVIPYFLKFVQKWPDIKAFADANQEEVMREWAGLGYYARARNMYKCAQIIVRDYDGFFPQEQKILKTLPGIGDYTSAAIAAIAFEKFAVVVDGNIERVIARYHAINTPLPEAKKEIRKMAERYTQNLSEAPGDYAQSLMDLGAAICTPRSPLCFSCPLNKGCRVYSKGKAEEFPNGCQKSQGPHDMVLLTGYKMKRGMSLSIRDPMTGFLAGYTVCRQVHGKRISRTLITPLFLRDIVLSTVSINFPILRMSLPISRWCFIYALFPITDMMAFRMVISGYRNLALAILVFQVFLKKSGRSCLPLEVWSPFPI